MWRSLILLAAILLALIRTAKGPRGLTEYLAAEFWSTLALQTSLLVVSTSSPFYLWLYIAMRLIALFFALKYLGIHPWGLVFALGLAVGVFFSCQDRTIYCFIPLVEGFLCCLAGISGTFKLLTSLEVRALAIVSVMQLLLGGWNFLYLLGLEPATNFWLKSFIVAGCMLALAVYGATPRQRHPGPALRYC